MILNRVVRQFAYNAEAISALASGVDAEQACWRPSPEDWSILEVVNHLYDEEREDFLTRLDLILHRPGDEWPAIHPGGWVTQRRYNERDLDESLVRFLAEREESLRWLGSLEAPDWSIESTHPAGFVLSAGDMLSSWLAHDFLHIRQLNELHYRYHLQSVTPFGIIYAGDW